MVVSLSSNLYLQGIPGETTNQFLLVGTQPTYQGRRLGGQTRVFVFFIWLSP